MQQIRSAYQDLKAHVASDCPQCVPSARLPEMCDQGKQLWDLFNTSFNTDDDQPACTACGNDDEDELRPGLNGDPYCADCRTTFADQDDCRGFAFI